MAQVPSNLIPTRLTQLMTDPAPSTQGLMMYVRNGVNYQVRVGDLLDTYARVTSVDVSGGTTGLTASGGPITTTGTITFDGTLNLEHGGTGVTSAAAAPFALKGANADITSMAGVAGGISAPDFVQFDTTPATIGGVGALGWNDGDGTLDLQLKGGNVTLQVGQEEVQLSFNEDISTIVDGNIIYTSGAQGNRIAVKKAQANLKSTSTGTIGMATEHISAGSEGFVTTQGLVRRLDTLIDSEGNALVEGDSLYLSSTVKGGYTKAVPSASSYRVFIGYVVRVHATVGSIYIRPNVYPDLDDINQVSIAAPADGSLLQYESSTSLWKNVAGSSVGVGTANALAGGLASQLVYQTGAGSTGFVANGTTGQVLTSAGSATPVWGDLSGGTF